MRIFLETKKNDKNLINSKRQEEKAINLKKIKKIKQEDQRKCDQNFLI